MRSQNFESVYHRNQCLILDGATGTELERRGFQLPPSTWSAAAIRDAPELLRQIHADYVTAGADILTANTFRTHERNLRGTKLESESAALTKAAVQIARQAAGGKAFVAGSIAPLEDCYSPELTPSDDDLQREHSTMIDNLLEADVDLLLIETQLTIREATIIAKWAQESGLPYFVSFVAGKDGKLLSGEPLSDAIQSVIPFRPLGCLVNCIPSEEVEKCFHSLPNETAESLIGAYANTGRMLSNGSWESTNGQDPAVYADDAKLWRSLGFRLIGGCCGTTPRHISHLTE